jgi:hypothetical protein
MLAASYSLSNGELPDRMGRLSRLAEDILDS